MFPVDYDGTGVVKHAGGAAAAGIGYGIQISGNEGVTITKRLRTLRAGAPPAGAKQKVAVRLDNADGDIRQPIQAAHQFLQFGDIGQIGKTIFQCESSRGDRLALRL